MALSVKNLTHAASQWSGGLRLRDPIFHPIFKPILAQQKPRITSFKAHFFFTFESSTVAGMVV